MPLILPAGVVVNWNNNWRAPGTPKSQYSVLVRQCLKNVGESRAVFPDIRWGWGDTPPSENTHYQFHDETLRRWTWIEDDTKEGCVLPVFTTDVGGKFHRNIFDAPMPLEEATRYAKSVTAGHPLFVYGIVQYEDVFPHEAGDPHGANHVVMYCYRITGFNTGESDNGRTTGWAGDMNDTGNCIDDKCPQYAYKKN
jgi:hypothetical protein